MTALQLNGQKLTNITKNPTTTIGHILLADKKGMEWTAWHQEIQTDNNISTADKRAADAIIQMVTDLQAPTATSTQRWNQACQVMGHNPPFQATLGTKNARTAALNKLREGAKQSAAA